MIFGRVKAWKISILKRMCQYFDFFKNISKFYVNSGKAAIKSYTESDPNLKSAMNILDKTSGVLDGYTQIIPNSVISKLQSFFLLFFLVIHIQ